MTTPTPASSRASSKAYRQLRMGDSRGQRSGTCMIPVHPPAAKVFDSGGRETMLGA
jgi:hypothetical protein